MLPFDMVTVDKEERPDFIRIAGDVVCTNTNMRRYVLSASTLGLGSDPQGNRGSVLLPAGAKITVLDPIPAVPTENPAQLIHVLWNGRGVSIFLVDLQQLGEQVRAAQG